ncbi:very short patch repair endonuclease [Sphingobacterium hotanense]|jgi:DNA mismatch endonuclease (patch repair protein)|uniref:very short patch repair endonuclease n=1 Tax=Sphingobacterium hotanense TaxID=649196 RepID=UPI0011F33CA2|nr:DNA mismatch endonuclease Vsr [Sphingobacterium hotanense]
MADVHDKATRSYNMSRIKGTDTKPEMLLRKYLHAHGIRYRLHNKNLPGKPDLTLAKYHTVIFVNGCFWHGHKGCKYFVLPKTRTEWWRDKIEETIKRDIKAMKDLKESGWNSTVIWECELKPEKRNTTLENILFTITKEAKN